MGQPSVPSAKAGELPAPAPVEAVGRGASADLGERLDWVWLAGLQQSQQWGPVASVDLEIGTLGSLLPAKFECHDRIFVQVGVLGQGSE